MASRFVFVASDSLPPLTVISSISMGHSWLLRAPGDNVQLCIFLFFWGEYTFVLGAGCVGVCVAIVFQAFSRRVLCFKHFNLRGKGGRPPLLPGGGGVLRGAALRPGARVARLPPLA